MGCQSCKIYESAYYHLDNNEGQHMSKYNCLASSNERIIWMKAINIIHFPQESFQKSFSEHQQLYQHPAFKQVKKDIPRTFPDAKFFADPSNLIRFENLLKKFVVYFPKIGYTQGLNFVAGYLLLAGFNDVEAFQCLARICLHEKLMMIGMYEDSFPLNRFYCALFWKLLQMKMPKLAQKIKLAEVPDEIWIFQWFISFFLYSFPASFVKRMWDFIICKKEFSMVLIALGIVKCLKKDMMNLVNPDEVDFFEYFTNLKDLEFCEVKIDLKKVITYANSINKHEISQAINEIDLPQNFYAMYFRPQSKQKEMWQAVTRKFQKQRDCYRLNPKLFDYRRNLDSIEHIQKLILEKSILYKSKSQSKYSNYFRTSNFTIELNLHDESFNKPRNFPVSKPMEEKPKLNEKKSNLKILDISKNVGNFNQSKYYK